MKTFNKKLFIKILCASLFVGLIISFVIFLISISRQKPVEIPEIEYVRVQYSYDENCCNFIGRDNQYIVKGEDAEPVSLKPKLGYYFLGWVTVENQDEYFDKDKFIRQELNVQDHIWLIAKFRGPVNSRVEFCAGKGGTVEGKLKQSVLYGAKGEPVIAIPKEGYRFIKWSDGETEAVRENASLRHLADSPYIYAEFERYSRIFEYVCNDGVLNTSETEIEINLDNIENISLPVPQRTDYKFEGWYSDWHHTIQIADNNGQLVVDKEWLAKDYFYTIDNLEGFLYAKWTPLIDVPTFKILMIFVTEVHGDFISGKNKEPETLKNVRVDYVMPESEKKAAQKTAQYMGDYLNAIMNGEVNFEIDLRFTTQPLSEEEFTCGMVGYYRNYAVDDIVPEFANIVDEYDSVINSFSLSGYENGFALTGGLAGSAGKKYACVNWDLGLYHYYADEILNVDNFLDLNSPLSFSSWEDLMNTYLHEFIHTVEPELGLLHLVMSHYEKRSFYVMRKYLSGDCEMNGENVGIPYETWLSKNKS